MSYGKTSLLLQDIKNCIGNFKYKKKLSAADRV
jgi:hypothetical protein